MKNSVLKTARALVIFKRLAKKELKTNNGLSAAEKLLCYRKGFFSSSYVLYNFRENDPELYLSDIEENIKARHINRNGLVYIDNKILFPLFLKPFVPVNEENLMIMKGKPVIVRDKNNFRNWDDFLNDLEAKNKAYILKQIDGASGFGIFKISYNGKNYTINQQETDRKQVMELLKKLHNYMVSDIIEQAEYSNKIYPKSVNTVRILTMVDPATNKAFIAAAAHRIGNEKSYPVDNCAMGGFTANIDIETGIMGKAVSTIVSKPSLDWYPNHSDTNQPIEGVVIPHWEYIKKTILEIADNLFFLPFIGWDIVVQQNGFTIIEGNDGPDVKLHQVHAPLLRDERVKSFFKYYKVIS